MPPTGTKQKCKQVCFFPVVQETTLQSLTLCIPRAVINEGLPGQYVLKNTVLSWYLTVMRLRKYVYKIRYKWEDISLVWRGSAWWRKTSLLYYQPQDNRVCNETTTSSFLTSFGLNLSHYNELVLLVSSFDSEWISHSGSFNSAAYLNHLLKCYDGESAKHSISALSI